MVDEATLRQKLVTHKFTGTAKITVVSAEAFLVMAMPGAVLEVETWEASQATLLRITRELDGLKERLQEALERVENLDAELKDEREHRDHAEARASSCEEQNAGLREMLRRAQLCSSRLKPTQQSGRRSTAIKRRPSARKS